MFFLPAFKEPQSYVFHGRVVVADRYIDIVALHIAVYDEHRNLLGRLPDILRLVSALSPAGIGRTDEDQRVDVLGEEHLQLLLLVLL